MTWVRLEDTVNTHPKTVAGRLEHFGLWAAGLCFCNLHHTDGVIPKASLRAVFPSDEVSMAELRKCATKLVELKRWEERSDHWLVHDYEEHQEEAMKAVAEVRRELERLKKRQQRLKKLQQLGALSPGDTPGQSSGTSRGHDEGTGGGHAGESPQGTDPPAAQGSAGGGAPELSPPPVPSRPVPSRPSERGTAHT